MLSCTVEGISRKMRISWSGSDNKEESEGNYDPITQSQTGRIAVYVADEEKIKTCTVSSVKYPASETLSVDVQLFTYS